MKRIKAYHTVILAFGVLFVLGGLADFAMWIFGWMERGFPLRTDLGLTNGATVAAGVLGILIAKWLGYLEQKVTRLEQKYGGATSSAASESHLIQ